jgi:CD2 antigen cytoplasmic tail-binding protein 2
MEQGYDSDSSQEGDSKKSKKPKKRDDDDDMFDDNPTKEDADANDDLDSYGKLKPKKVDFVSYETFEGQEIEKDEPTDIEDEVESIPSTPGASDDEEVIDEEVGLAGSRKHAPKIERFNLRQEQTEGAFTADGTYVRKAGDPRAHQDSWMEGLTKGQIRRAEEGMKKQQQRLDEIAKREAEQEKMSPTERLEKLIRFLKPRETPLEALARLNQGKKKKWQPSQKWKKSKMTYIDEESTAVQDENAKIKEQVEEITSHADKLLALGNANIYSTPRERLIMLYQDDTGERFREDPQSIGGSNISKASEMWEYKWPGSEEVYSSFTSKDMESWKAGGFFGDGVLCRPSGSSDEWKISAEIKF